MQGSASSRTVIPAGTVQRTVQPVLLDCSDTSNNDGSRALSVIPLMEGTMVAGIEVRCGCGSSVVIECVYPDATENNKMATTAGPVESNTMENEA